MHLQACPQRPAVLICDSDCLWAVSRAIASLAGNSKKPARLALLAFLGGPTFWHSGQASVSGISGIPFRLTILEFGILFRVGVSSYLAFLDSPAFRAFWLPLAPDNWHFWNAHLSGDNADIAYRDRPTPRGVK